VDRPGRFAGHHEVGANGQQPQGGARLPGGGLL
jgi:hypothetical protein